MQQKPSKPGNKALTADEIRELIGHVNYTIKYGDVLKRRTLIRMRGAFEEMARMKESTVAGETLPGIHRRKANP